MGNLHWILWTLLFNSLQSHPLDTFQSKVGTSRWVIELHHESHIPLLAKEMKLKSVRKMFGNHFLIDLGGGKSDKLLQQRILSDRRIRWAEKQTYVPELELLASSPSTTHSNCSVISLRDPLWPDQWYLVRSLSVSFLNSTPSRRDHGTKVAGVLNGRINEICGVGVSPDAKIADIQLLSDSAQRTLQADEIAEALVHRLDSISIFSNSWVSSGSGTIANRLPEIIKRALSHGVREGRHKKGALYVWGSGNSAGILDSCSYDMYANTIYAIVVTGILHGLTRLPDAELCPSILVSAFTSSSETEKKIVTTDAHGGCTTAFGRVSAAVPMVSGAIALALQANSRLSYRDIMHLLTRTSNSDVAFNPNDFFTNGAGFRISRAYGFGLLDVGKLVSTAMHWENIPNVEHCVIFDVDNTSRIAVPGILRINHNTGTSSCEISFVEHVEVDFAVAYRSSGQMLMTLQSPAGTESLLLPGRPLRLQRLFGHRCYKCALLGEDPRGTWVLNVTDGPYTLGADSGAFRMLRITIHGMSNYIHTTKGSSGLLSTPPSLPTTFTSTPCTGCSGSTCCPITDGSSQLNKGNPVDPVVVSVAVIAVVVVLVAIAVVGYLYHKKIIKCTQRTRPR